MRESRSIIIEFRSCSRVVARSCRQCSREDAFVFPYIIRCQDASRSSWNSQTKLTNQSKNQRFKTIDSRDGPTTRSTCTRCRLRTCSCCDIEQSQMIFTFKSSRWRFTSHIATRQQQQHNSAQHISIAATREHQRDSFAHTHVTIYYRCRRSNRSHIIITCHTSRRTDWRDLSHRFEIVISHIFFRRLTWDTRTQRRDIVARDIRSDKTM